MTQRKVAQPDLIDFLLADYKKPEDLIGEHGILKQLTKAIVERALQAELAAHLGHDKHEAVANDTSNTRNGSSAKTLKGDFGALPRETATAALSRSSLPNIRPAGPASTTRFCRCTPAAERGCCRFIGLQPRPPLHGDDRAGNSKPPRRNVRHRSLADADFLGHRCRHGGSQGLAGAPAGCALPDRLIKLLSIV